MRIALISDIHANVVALEAILRDIEAQNPDRILSLGDQVNLGPSPQETLRLLDQYQVKCLDGNHERYVRSVMDGLPGFEGANFDSVRFTAERVTRAQITLPETEQIGSLCFCHALPGMDTFPVYDPERAVPKLRTLHFDGIRHIICGHGHNPTQIRTEDLVIDSIGSSGCMDAGIPGAASYNMLWLYDDTAVLRPQFVSYDIRRVCRVFYDTGMIAQNPVMSRLICQQMTTNQSYMVPFIRLADQISKSLGESCISMDALHLADEQYDWPDGKRVDQYWHDIEALLKAP